MPTSQQKEGKKTDRQLEAELMAGEVGPNRRKAIETIMRDRKVDFRTARRIQTDAILRGRKKKASGDNERGKASAVPTSFEGVL